MIYFCLQRTRECQFVFLFLGHAGKHGQGNLPDGESPKLSFSRKKLSINTVRHHSKRGPHALDKGQTVLCQCSSHFRDFRRFP